jgi:peptide deformylase
VNLFLDDYPYDLLAQDVYTRGSFFPILAVAGMATLNVSAALFAEHEICIFGNDVLRKEAEPIKKFDDALKQRAERMFHVMEATGDGVGLAAPQIGCSEQLVVAQVKMPPFPKDFPEEQKEALRKKILGLSKKIRLTDHTTAKVTEFDDIVQFGQFAFTNLVWEPVGNTKAPSREGCLSLPGIMGRVPRYKEIVLNFQDLNGHPCTLQCDGLLAQIIQHETDHLNGVLYVDDISDLCVVGEMPVWKAFPLLYEQMKALKDEALTKNKMEESRQEAKQEGREFKPSEKTFWISEKNKKKALAIIEKIGGEEHTLDYDTLLPQSKTADDAVEAKSEAK